MGLIWSKYSCKKRIVKKINESEMKSRQDSFWHSILFAKRWSENHKKISKVFHVSVRNLEIRKNVSMMHLKNCNYAVQTIKIYQIWLRFRKGLSFEVNLWMVVWSKFNLLFIKKRLQWNEEMNYTEWSDVEVENIYFYWWYPLNFLQRDINSTKK